MPNYDYRCECGEVFEERNSIEKRKMARCKCGKIANLKPGAVALAGFNNLGQSTRKAFN